VGSHCEIEMYLKAKAKLWKLKYFTMQKYNLQNDPRKEAKILPRYYHSVTDLKFQQKPRYHLSNILIPIIITLDPWALLTHYAMELTSIKVVKWSGWVVEYDEKLKVAGRDCPPESLQVLGEFLKTP